MTLDEFKEYQGIDHMKVLGELKNFRYYLVTDDQNQEVGEPIVVVENKVSKLFDICSNKQRDSALAMFG